MRITDFIWWGRKDILTGAGTQREWDNEKQTLVGDEMEVKMERRDYRE